MGISPSKRISGTLHNSSEFNSACDSVFSDLLALTQRAFSGVLPYQLSDASVRLHLALSTSHPLVKKWAPDPPSQAQVDQAYRSIRPNYAASPPQDHAHIIGTDEFKAFAVDLFTDAVIDGARKALAVRVPIGVAGIAGLGLATRSGKDFVGAAIGVYALGVATSARVQTVQ
ncbi:hypothetical protein V2J09_020731 [Rumex salicifolius]